MDPTSASWRFPARRYVLTYTPLNCQLDKPEGRPSRMVICDRRPHNMVGNTFFGPSTVELIRVVLLAWSWVLDVHPPRNHSSACTISCRFGVPPPKWPDLFNELKTFCFHLTFTILPCRRSRRCVPNFVQEGLPQRLDGGFCG